MAKNSTQKYIDNVIANSDTYTVRDHNTPAQYKSKQTEYLATRTRAFIQNRAYLAADYVEAQVQGLTDDFYAWTTTKIRLADISTLNKTSLVTKKSDDFKEVLLADTRYNYIPIGAKIVTMGSTWIVTNPENISSPAASTIVARCNASFNSYDDYGNIVTEPVVIDHTAMLSNRPETPLNLVLMNGYFNVFCQLNENTRKLDENSRIVLGNKPYIITGYTDFFQEFSGDRDSAHQLSFTVRLDEPTEADDVSENYIANGNNMVYGAEIYGPTTISQTASYAAAFTYNGENVESTDERPVSFTWSAENGLFVSEGDGVFTVSEGITSGTEIITATLEQNPDITAQLSVSIVASDEPSIEFGNFAPKAISQFTSVTYTPVYYTGSEQQNVAFDWSFSGADEADYNVALSADGTQATIECVSPSRENLVIIAEYNGVQASLSVRLEGY